MDVISYALSMIKTLFSFQHRVTVESQRIFEGNKIELITVWTKQHLR